MKLNRIQYLEDLKQQGSNGKAIEILISPKGEYLWKFIERDPNSNLKVIKLIENYGEFGLLKLIEDDPDNEFLTTLSEDPSKIKDIGEVSDSMQILKELEVNRMQQEVSSILKNIKKDLTVDTPKIHEDEYLENFHCLFDGTFNEKLTKQEELERGYKIRSWLLVAKSMMSPVKIVDSNNNVLFIHPGMMAKIDNSGNVSSWQNFEKNSRLNGDIHPRLKKEYQEDFINKYGRYVDNSKYKINEKNIQDLIKITNYFNLKKYGNKVVKSEEPLDTPIAKSVDWDLYD